MRSLRRRLTVVATVTVAVTLVVVAVALLGLQRRQLIADVDTALARRADELERAVATGVRPIIDDQAVEDRAAQIATVDGRVVAATANLAGRSAIASAPQGGESIRTLDDVPVDDDPFRVLSRRITVDGAPFVVHVAESIDDVDESVRVLTESLAIAFPVVLGLLAWLTWLLIGRTLRPVERAAKAQERFVSDASHELRSPLARIRTRLEVDLTHPDGVDLRHSAGAVLDESRAMERLVDDLLQLAGSDAPGAGRQRSAPVDLDDLVLGEAGDQVRDGVAVDTGGVSGGSVRGDAGALRRLVRNLLDNAVRHATARVAVTLIEDGRDVVLTIDDDGPGIPAERRAGVFGRFVRLDDSRAAPAGGAGLGLAIAHDIATGHGGTITVEEAPIGGARLTVTLPRQ